MSRSYEDYEELGRYIQDTDVALGQAQGKLMYMFPLEDEDRRELPSEYEGLALDVRFALDKLRDAIGLELEAELPGLEVPPGMPSKPPPFSRERELAARHNHLRPERDPAPHLEALDAGDVADLGTSGFTTREDVLGLLLASSDSAKQMKKGA